MLSSLYLWEAVVDDAADSYMDSPNEVPTDVRKRICQTGVKCFRRSPTWQVATSEPWNTDYMTAEGLNFLPLSLSLAFVFDALTFRQLCCRALLIGCSCRMEVPSEVEKVTTVLCLTRLTCMFVEHLLWWLWWQTRKHESLKTTHHLSTLIVQTSHCTLPSLLILAPSCKILICGSCLDFSQIVISTFINKRNSFLFLCEPMLFTHHRPLTGNVIRNNRYTHLRWLKVIPGYRVTRIHLWDQKMLSVS